MRRHWAGDTYVAWSESGGSTCVRIDVAGDRSENLHELRTLLSAWARTQPDAQADGSVEGRARVTACR